MGAVKDAILRYVDQTCTDGSAGWVPVEERVAVFDNDGTLWCEKPMPIQLDCAYALDDGPEKPVRIWNRTGRRPVLAAGNSDGDNEMLDFTQHQDKPTRRLLVLHDDAEREFDYVIGAERALERAADRGWTGS